MADDPAAPPSVVAAAEAIDQAATEKAVEIAAPAVEAVVEAAAARVDAAQEAAQQITDAAMATEIGRQIAAVRTELDTWRNQIQTTVANQAAHLTQMQSELQPLREQLTAAVATLATISSLIQPKSEPQPVADKVITEKINPDGGVVQEVVEMAPKPTSRRRWI